MVSMIESLIELVGNVMPVSRAKFADMESSRDYHVTLSRNQSQMLVTSGAKIRELEQTTAHQLQEIRNLRGTLELREAQLAVAHEDSEKLVVAESDNDRLRACLQVARNALHERVPDTDRVVELESLVSSLTKHFIKGLERADAEIQRKETVIRNYQAGYYS